MKIKEKLAVMRFFLKENTKGGVTVFICLILIPVLMFSGLMIDFARIKLYHAEAASVSASYADAVLSQYDEMLYNVYGLLAVTQEEEAIKALDVIREYMASAYDPSSTGKGTNASKSDLKHLPNNVMFIGMNNAALDSLWSPYGNTKMVLSSVADKKSGRDNSLANKYVFADQVCDYMKIIGPVDLAWNGILEATESGKKAKENAEIMQERRDVDTKYDQLDGKLKELYSALLQLNECNIWQIPNEINSYITADNNVIDRYDFMYNNYIALAGGKYFHSLSGYSKSDKDCSLGVIFNNALNELKKDSGLYTQWVGEIIAGTASDNSQNYLYQLYCYRAAMNADSEDELKNVSYKDPETGLSCKLGKNASGDIRWDYSGPDISFKIYINKYKAEVNQKYNEWHSQLVETSRDRSLAVSLKNVIDLLGGGTNLLGESYEGINTIAGSADKMRSDFVENCKSKPDNEMAAGLAEEYSFSKEDSDDIKFVGDFDYNWLKEKYTNNWKFLKKLDEYVTAERDYIVGRMDQLYRDIYGSDDNLSKYLDERIKALEDYGRGLSDNTENVKWKFSLNKSNEHYLLFEIEKDKLYFKDLDKLQKKLKNENAEWFDIVNTTPSAGDPDYPELVKILEKWYGANGSSSKKDAKTTVYKNLLKNLKAALTENGDAGKALIESFKDISIPECFNAHDSDENDNVKDQNAETLFGDEGDFNTSVTVDGTKRNTDYYITKLLMMDYDWNFFAGATFGKNTSDTDNKLKGMTLKGEKITDKTNYLVNEIKADNETTFFGGAELEYIYWGDRSAKNNLTAVKNQITIIRAIENFASTYSISEINQAIGMIRNALAGIPIAALIVPPLIRAAIAMAETYMDLQALYEGKSIALYKTKISHLTLMNNDKLKGIIDEMFTSEGNSSPLSQKSSSSDDDETIMFNYSQFVILCTMLFCDTDTIVERTQTLVELNMNLRLSNKDTVKNAKTADDLKFRLSDAKVTVTSVCTIDKMNLLVLGGIFKDETVEDYLSGDKTEILKNGFSYTVSRSY